MRAARWLVAGTFFWGAASCRFESAAISASGIDGNVGGHMSAAGGSHVSAAGGSHSTGTGGSSSSATGDPSDSATGGSSGSATGGSSGSATGGSSSSGTGGSDSSATGGSDSNATGGSIGNATGGADSSATGGSSSNGTGGSDNSGTGGSGGSGGSTNLPSDGSQLSPCTMAQGECNDGLGCYSPSSPFGTSGGRGVCSKLCNADDDCDGLEPSSVKYVCELGVTIRVCEIPCDDENDTTTCPSGLTCQQTAGAPLDGGTAGPISNFHCKYPPAQSTPSGPWERCGDGQHDCGPNLVCAGRTSSPSGTGYCTKSCMMDKDCDQPSSGSITPKCVTVSPGGMMGMASKFCGLDCDRSMDHCPDGESCMMITTPAGDAQRCEYD